MAISEQLVLEIRAEVGQLRAQLDELRNRLQGIDTSWTEKLQENIEQSTQSAKQLASQFESIVSTIRTIALSLPFVGFIKEGIEFNKQIEQARIGFAGILTSIAQIRNEQGRLVEGAEKYANAVKLSNQLLNELRIAGLQTVLTFQDLVQISQGIMAPFLSAGGNLKEFSQFVVLLSNAVAALGLPMNQVVQETRDLLMGTIDMNSQLARSLGITNEMVNRWREQGTLFQELTARLQGFQLASKDIEGSFTGLLAKAKEVFQVFAGMATAKVFEAIKKDLDEFVAKFLVVKDGKIELSVRGQELVEKISETLTNLYNIISTLAKAVGFLTTEFGGFITKALEIYIVVKAVSALKSAVEGLIRSMRTLSTVGGTAITGLGALFSRLNVIVATALVGWNLGEMLREWLDEQTKGAFTKWLIKIETFIIDGINRLRALIGKIPGLGRFLGISEEELQESLKITAKMRELAEEDAKRYKEAQQKTAQEITKAGQITAQAVRKVSKQQVEEILKSLKEQEQVIAKLQEMKQKLKDSLSLQDIMDALQDEAKDFSQKLELSLDTSDVEERIDTLKRKLRELQDLLKENLEDEARKQVLREILQTELEIAQATVEGYQRRKRALEEFLRDAWSKEQDYARKVVELTRERNNLLAQLEKERQELLTKFIPKELQIQLGFTTQQKPIFQVGNILNLVQQARDLANQIQQAVAQGLAPQQIEILKMRYQDLVQQIRDGLKQLTPEDLTQAFQTFLSTPKRALTDMFTNITGSFERAREMVSQLSAILQRTPTAQGVDFSRLFGATFVDNVMKPYTTSKKA
jgi:chromosome segregation ATPase